MITTFIYVLHSIPTFFESGLHYATCEFCNCSKLCFKGSKMLGTSALWYDSSNSKIRQDMQIPVPGTNSPTGFEQVDKPRVESLWNKTYYMWMLMWEQLNPWKSLFSELVFPGFKFQKQEQDALRSPRHCLCVVASVFSVVLSYTHTYMRFLEVLMAPS